MKYSNLPTTIWCWTILFAAFSLCGTLYSEDGYRLWLRYEPINDAARLDGYHKHIKEVLIPGTTATDKAIRQEMNIALPGMLGKSIAITDNISDAGTVIISIPDDNEAVKLLTGKNELEALGNEGYLIKTSLWQGQPVIIITANTAQGLLYGSYGFLRQIQTGKSLEHIYIQAVPRLQHRLLNHWDNPNRSVERGYAGRSIWNWRELPGGDHSRYIDYARANASIGINGTALNNVNADPVILSSKYLEKAAALADTFRPYGIKVFLSIKFSSPVLFGDMDTADPLEESVQQWWNKKADEIYTLIPDFGGFLVKANSEGQPGPQDYGRNHADGANMLAAALKPHGGIVMWRSFVYDVSIDPDRFKCGYLEFVPLDGTFSDNVFVQPKNGPIDFQPLEPFNPLFGSMPKTPLMLELQITQEYTGQARHLVYQGPMWKEALMADTFADGAGTRLGDIVEGSVDKHPTSGIAGVSGIGTDRNWSGHHFSQSNWYAYGRLAWNFELTSEEIALEWTKMTWSNDPEVVRDICEMMAGSWQACVNYMTPLGLAHMMAEGHHYGPQPDFANAGRPDWTSVYYHRADKAGIGFDRTASGSNALTQYKDPLSKWLSDPQTTPVDYLLWYHHLPWDWTMPEGNTLWDEMEKRYQNGVDYVKHMQITWDSLEDEIDPERFKHVKDKLADQYKNACEWRDVCLEYFGKVKAGTK